MKPAHVSESSSAGLSARPPRLAGPVQSTGSSPAKFAPTEFGNVLIVDRDAPTRRVLGAWFADRRHFVAFADNPAEAEVTLATIHFDLIVCNAAASSHAARRWIERLFQRPPCPVIFVTAHPTLETAIRIANLPHAGYLAKPVDLVAFERLVARCFAPSVPVTGRGGEGVAGVSAGQGDQPRQNRGE